jgi:ADP-L-glycero-D-manno-heptose 6-epimerase
MWIVTGANGFIGSNLVLALLRRQAGPVVAVDEPGAELRYFAADDVRRVLGKDQLLDFLAAEGGQTVRGVYHLGATSSTTVTDRDEVLANNTQYTRQLWQWCAAQRVPLVYASTAATYGDGSAGYSDQDDPRRLKPLNLYGESKHLFDLWAIEQPETASPPRWAGVKYFNVYGPREAHKGPQASMGYHWFNQVRDTGEARLFKSYREGVAHGEQRRDFIYVGDAVGATMHLMEAESVTNGLYNVGTGEARTFADLARAVFLALDREPKLQFIEMPESLRRQYQYFTQATISKLRQSGFDRPMRSVEEGMLAYATWRIREGT